MSIGINTPRGVAFWTMSLPDLDGRAYLLQGDWNQRESKWYLTIRDPETNETIHGPRKVVANWDLLRTCADARRPLGMLVALDVSGAGDDPGFDDLGTRVILTYTAAAELP